MEARETVMKEREVEYDSNCGQSICCDILPKYIEGGDRELCYLEISTIVEKFAESERRAQAEISFKAGQEDIMRLTHPYFQVIAKHNFEAGILKVVEWIDEHSNPEASYTDDLHMTRSWLELPLNPWQAQLKIWFKDSPEYLKKWGIK